MKSVGKKILISSMLIATSFSATLKAENSNEFFYKSKQSNEIMTKYSEIVTANSMIEYIIITNKENQKIIQFDGLRNKEANEKKYNGKLNVINTEGEYKKNIKLNFNNNENTKTLTLDVNTNNEESILKTLLNSDKTDFIKYLTTSNYDLFIESENDLDFVLNLLDLDNREKLRKILKKINANNIKEYISISRNEKINEKSKLKYKIDIDKLLNIEVSGMFYLEDNKIIFDKLNIDSNVTKEIEEFKEFEEIFNIKLIEGYNSKELKIIEIIL